MIRILLGALGDRFRTNPRMQRIVEHVHRCGPRPVGEMLIELLEEAGADPAVLDRLENRGWDRLDPETVRQVGGRDFPRPPLRGVPKRERDR
jgi:hypothetical protein